MRTKRKVSLTIDDEIYCALEKAAKIKKVPKSRLAQEAFELWLKNEVEVEMARGYEDMAEEDAGIADVGFDAQREILS